MNSIKIKIFKYLDYVLCFECVCIDRKNSCFAIGYALLDVVACISLDIATDIVVDIFINKDGDDVCVLECGLRSDSNDKVVYDIRKEIHKTDNDYKDFLTSLHMIAPQR
jgi:hypothetical protein